MSLPVKTKKPPRELSRPFPVSAVAVPACFVLFFLYVWLRLDPSLEYDNTNPVFLGSAAFFKTFTERPGGLLDYLAAFLAQLNYYGWLGALVFTVIAGLMFLFARWFLRRLTGATPEIVPVVPVLLLLWLRERPYVLSLPLGIGLLLALGLALACALLPTSRVPLRLAACWVLAPPLFYIAGTWPCLTFVMLTSLYEGLSRRQWMLGLGCLFAASVGPLWAIYGCGLESLAVLLPWKGGAALAGAITLYLFLPLASVFLMLLPKAPAPIVKAAHGRHASSSPVPQVRWFQAPLVKRAFAATVFVGAALWVWLSFDSERQGQAQIESCARRGHYAQVVAVASRLGRLELPSEIRLYQALYHTGHLCEDLFSFRNQTGWEALPGLRWGVKVCRAQSDVLLQLGLVADAEHLAHEALEWDGEYPDVLRVLAKVNILENRPQAARVFLNVLRQIPFQRSWADAYLAALRADPRMSGDHELAQIRARMVKADLPHTVIPTESFLRQLLHANPTNQMAFEYLMTHYLLSGDLDKVVERISQWADFGYTAIPRHCEEALLLYQQVKGVQVNLTLKVRPETQERFRQWAQLMRTNPEDRSLLARNFGDTYWYYYRSREAPGSKPTTSPDYQ